MLFSLMYMPLSDWTHWSWGPVVPEWCVCIHGKFVVSMTAPVWFTTLCSLLDSDFFFFFFGLSDSISINCILPYTSYLLQPFLMQLMSNTASKKWKCIVNAQKALILGEFSLWITENFQPINATRSFYEVLIQCWWQSSYLWCC